MRVFALVGYGSAAPVATPTPDESATVLVTTVSKPTTCSSTQSGHTTGLPTHNSKSTVTPASSNWGAPTITVITDTSPLGDAVTFSSDWPFPGGPSPVSITGTLSVPPGSGWQPGGPISSVGPSPSRSSSHTILRPITLM
ncbi:hypothetical protein GSI_11657 [Ganoderma sinense ZZ0214-1]|uniref:Uncharacterized protein n=1 Tax=Ganoderma sinense ZZ0214-1 TaxID=1077348 RepID=A0A2G8RWP3_9APHY|nr:hypothetical protein GSI_11657 [Ganoderma sinense ZZ0214-1]